MSAVLTPEQRNALACRCHEGLCPLHNEASDGYVEHEASDLLTVVERIVAEQVTAVLDEVERRIVESVPNGYELTYNGAEDPIRAAYVEGVRNAHSIVREVRQWLTGGGEAPTETPDERERGLYGKYHVERLSDPTGKHADCRYFVLDPQHDDVARRALIYYAMVTPNADLRRDLNTWLDSLTEDSEVRS